jgi:DNA-binding NarL/FixJ family response regulator
VSERATVTTCLVADDHPAVVEAVADVLGENGIEIAGRARDGKRRGRADRAPQAPGRHPRPAHAGHVRIEVARHVARTVPETAVILYTAFGDRALLTEALDAVPRGFVLKEAPLAEVVRAVELVAAGADVRRPGPRRRLSSSAATEKMKNLTQRERDVLRLLADGMSNEEIGKALFISPETVRTHVRKAMAKLEADTRTQAVATALRQSLIA